MNGSGEQYQMEKAKQAAPEEKRRCEHMTMGVRRCRRGALQGEELCQAHLNYAESSARTRVDVLLLEDEATIVHVLSQTARGLATGAIPPGNGNAVIGACRVVIQMLAVRRKAEQRERKLSMSIADPTSPKPGDAFDSPAARSA